ncbi:uncharacterized protein ASPGLDRAFT_138850 [Aspergillus glaucus CBS 516.65]|uniref:Uncharacterized protein n=1 Tax=Aspergillus glaucus CBS 516.65 TaxID=1160497 RepID=A0A1L9V3F7_ASPGL|nr:hypothetical protein ASPGLDRAFT_138850 [Aspergillus glaucus CBS 516.65]OJJ78474.1 hypothetical protein ASPGLDRAFT_138850 [Aspergillus glaucus CBS 516.65]
MPEHLDSIGSWLVRLFTNIFFQPDDIVSSRTFIHGISRGITVRINGNYMTYDEFRDAIEDARAKNYISEQQNDELLESQTDPKGTSGSVAQLSQFTLKDKVTGNVTNSSTVILATIEWAEGKRVLTQLTEVSK